MRLITRLMQPVNTIRGKYYTVIYRKLTVGSDKWLIATEIKYGGRVENVPRNKVSSKDTRTKFELNRGGMVGGDRMLYEGYAKKYSEYLAPFLNDESVTLIEVGILKGSGLAVWCDLFKNGRIIGLDIDLEHIKSNMHNLKQRNAFKYNNPELYEYDQLNDNNEFLRTILKSDTVDICIDDGIHSNDSIITTLNSVYSHLSERFVYFIEDNKNVHKHIQCIYPGLNIEVKGELTIITR